MDQKVQTARSQIEQFKKDKYHFDPETGRCLLPEDAKSDYDNALKILSEQLYTKDIHFIFELIQNADDARATEVAIFFNAKTYGTSSLLGSKMSKWQGPALYVHNNAVFSQSDFQALL